MKKITGFELKRVVAEGFKNRDGLRQISDFVVNNYTIDLDDERKAELSADLAVGIAMGEVLSRKDHILTGVTIGAVGTIGAMLTYKVVKNKRKNLNFTKEELKAMGIKPFEYKESKVKYTSDDVRDWYDEED